MKSTERLKKLRDVGVEELERQGSEMSEQAFRLRFQFAMGQSETLKKMRELRKERARLLTVLKEKKKG